MLSSLFLLLERVTGLSDTFDTGLSPDTVHGWIAIARPLIVCRFQSS